MACGDQRPEAGGGVGTIDNNPGSCATPQAGCACTPGSDAPCAVETKGDDHFIFCEKGTRTCATGVWSECVTNGETSVQARIPTSFGSGLHTDALGMSSTCAGDGGTADPCDPYCQVTTDNPVGLDAGGGVFTVKDGGLIVAGCGDGLVKGIEECDDGNNASGDGCSSDCVLENGYQCLVPGAPCTAATCGNAVREGNEQCDDGNHRPYDGCSPTCQKEAVCPGGTCVAVCGDGLKFPAEACDDGNVKNGDGCSSTCTIEPNATCTVVTTALPATIAVPVIYRDFNGRVSNPDFELASYGAGPGAVNNTLAADGKPTLSASHPSWITSTTSFNEWYHDTAGHNKVIFDTLTLSKVGTNYTFTSNNFFPLDGNPAGYGLYASSGHDFHFTSELRYPFSFQGGEVLNFTGDDDVFVFINGKLAVDLGGVHGAENGSVTLNAATATALGLAANGTYEIAVFQAERHTTGSNYTLTLGGFVHAKSSCSLPADLTFVRDFQGVCPVGSSPTWQLFQWKAEVQTGASIAFRAATAATQAALPAAPPAASPVTVPIGTATPANSPAAGPVVWRNDTTPPAPVPVSQRLKAVGTPSKAWLRVYMSFNPTAAGISPRLDAWQQLYDCVPSE
jgi:fibro-slime domain-containing protein